MTARTGCLLGPGCGLCQIRGEQAAAEQAAYTALQRRITKALATAAARNAQRRAA